MLKINKIPLEPFIEILQNLYESGAEFIDISGESGTDDQDNKRDTIRISVQPDYMVASEKNLFQEVELEYYEEEEDEEQPSSPIVNKKTKNSISDEDIDDLI